MNTTTSDQRWGFLFFFLLLTLVAGLSTLVKQAKFLISTT